MQEYFTNVAYLILLFVFTKRRTLYFPTCVLVGVRIIQRKKGYSYE